MGCFVIILTTLIAILVLGYRNFKYNRRIKDKIKIFIKEINNAYLSIFKQGKILSVAIQLTLIIAVGIFTFISIITSVNKYVNIAYIESGNIFLKLIISLISFIIVYYAIGYVLYFSGKIHRFIRRTEDKNFKVNFILSYFIISTYLAILIVFPTEFNKIVKVALIGIVISYYLNMKLLFSLMINPHNAKSIKDDNISFSRIMVASIIILVMLVLNLYLEVCAMHGLDKYAYSNINGDFSLFYYTIITFTTIGYGDIVPISFGGRMLAIIISITSVVCLIVFLSSVLSYREKFSDS